MKHREAEIRFMLAAKRANKIIPDYKVSIAALSKTSFEMQKSVKWRPGD